MAWEGLDPSHSSIWVKIAAKIPKSIPSLAQTGLPQPYSSPCPPLPAPTSPLPFIFPGRALSKAGVEDSVQRESSPGNNGSEKGVESPLLPQDPCPFLRADGLRGLLYADHWSPT